MGGDREKGRDGRQREGEGRRGEGRRGGGEDNIIITYADTAFLVKIYLLKKKEGGRGQGRRVEERGGEEERGLGEEGRAGRGKRRGRGEGWRGNIERNSIWPLSCTATFS